MTRTNTDPGVGLQTVALAKCAGANDIFRDVTADAPSTPLEPLPESLVEAGVYSSATAAFEHGLVILAMQRACWIGVDAAGHHLLVEPFGLEEVRRQLACFDRESVGWPPPPVHDPAATHRIELVTPVLWSLLILAVYWAEFENPAWIDAGSLDSQALFQRHEWWRPFTALFLHADAGHVLSNGLNGILVFSAVTTTFRRWRGWLLVLVAGVLGNIASAAINYTEPYKSVGASTAVFAGVGLLAGRAVRLMMRVVGADRWRAMFVPLAAGTTVLALYGAGGVHIDVIAHLTGFLAGLAIGACVGARRSEAAK